jgi:hypothetical protein
MSTAKAQRVLLERFANSATVLLAVLLDSAVPHADGRDSNGRSVILVGRQNLGSSESAKRAIDSVLAALANGQLPERVHAVAYAPRASQAIATVASSEAREILIDGPRGTGKTQAVPAALAVLAERHARANGALPLRVLWLHDSMVNAAVKTGRSLEQSMWFGLWKIVDDRRRAVLTIAGRDMVHADFVGTTDEASAERLRAECHVVCAEELVPSLNDTGGIEERRYELALTSMRLPTRRRVAIATTNPGAQDSWPFKRFIECGGRTGTARCSVPADDRLSTDERQALRAAFRDSPDLQRRLAEGEWSDILLGETVAVGFGDHHVTQAIACAEGAPLLMGHDAGLTPVTVVGQLVGHGVHVLAALASERAGTRQHLESLVQPWLAVNAPWRPELIHFYDPSMDTPDQSNLESSPARVLREVLGGASYAGAVTWPGRRDPLLTLLTRLNPTTGKPALQISAEGCPLLVSALRSRWHYPSVNGVTSRELPVKNHPWSDLGDALCYLIGGAQPSNVRPPQPVKTDHSFDPRMSFAAW